MVKLRFTEVYNDLTASKRAEQGLIAREAHLKSILETVPDAMIVIDERGAIRSFSDKVQIQQVLLNLMRNAMEAMEHSERREILLSTTAAADDLLMVNVADSGPGIDDALASQLFRPFVTTKPHGMGVGLSISRIVEAHGGRIWVEPNPGGGAAFRFTLHLVPEQDLADA
jgi:C4-dicarboxylate-specific signal transduction histidine kinase